MKDLKLANQWRNWAETNNTAALSVAKAVSTNPFYNHYSRRDAMGTLDKLQHGTEQSEYLYNPNGDAKNYLEYKKKLEDKSVAWKHEHAPWLLEPDEMQFVHCGYHCTAKRNMTGAWCGYVKLPDTHPDYGTSYDDLYSISVHGGLTYSEGGEFGFDCGHGGDISPMVSLLVGAHPDDRYRNIGYVIKEIMSMAEQFKERENKDTIIAEMVDTVAKKEMTIEYLYRYFNGFDYALLKEELHKIKDGKESE